MLSILSEPLKETNRERPQPLTDGEINLVAGGTGSADAAGKKVVAAAAYAGLVGGLYGGLVGGPAGAVVGAAIGATVGVVSEYIAPSGNSPVG